MVFSAPEFLFFFLPACLGLYFVVPRRYRNLVLLVASVLFYTVGGGVFVVLLLISTATDYAAGRVVQAGITQSKPRLRRLGVAISVLVNVALLGYFKYANFFIDQLNGIAAQFGWGTIAWASVALPIGISFYTFQSMSYTIDIHRGRTEPLDNIWDFALYVALFPQLIAGPIVRFHEISGEILQRSTTLDRFGQGAIRFTWGLMKKVVIADSVALVVDEVFALDVGDLTTPVAWLGVLAYTVQIYFDFSGYSDMAIGLGHMFGFTFPENFRRPYSAVSITDFWRRWHITLSNWFRDYLYIPLGGSRGTKAFTYRNLVIVFIVTGLWHGANWTFILWGAYHGALLVLERLSDQRSLEKVTMAPLRRGLTLLAVIVGWVLFRADSVGHALGILGAMFSIQGGDMPPEVAVALTTRAAVALIVGMSVALLPRDFVGGLWIAQSSSRWGAVGRFALGVVLVPYTLALVLSQSFSPFLYYQF